MNKHLKYFIKGVFRKFPKLAFAVVSVARPFQFFHEKAAYEGRDTKSGNGRPSIVFFGHYRCATMMLMKRLSDLIDGMGYKTIDYQGYIHNWPIPDREKFQRDEKEHKKWGRFRKEGRFYSPLRYFVRIPELEDFHTILVLRDPRDVLVSRFYSEKFAHVRMDKRFLEHCQEVEKLDLDEFVVQYADQVLEHYQFYIAHKDALRNALVINYEEVITDFRGFLAQVNSYAKLGRSDEELDRIAAKESFTVEAEDKYSHKRSVEARNFETKLNEETIQKLNDKFADVLTHFGWEK